MANFDHDDIKLRLEAMKLNQGSLQQLMTLSAGGLALYFGFIGKAAFLAPLKWFGVLVVLSWIVSLCAAIIAHRLHGTLFLCLYHLSAAFGRARSLESLPEQVNTEAEVSIHREPVVKRALARLHAEEKRFDSATEIFEQTFFPIQSRVIQCMTVALYSFLLGFGLLGAAYVVWSFGT